MQQSFSYQCYVCHASLRTYSEIKDMVNVRCCMCFPLDFDLYFYEYDPELLVFNQTLGHMRCQHCKLLDTRNPRYEKKSDFLCDNCIKQAERSDDGTPAAICTKPTRITSRCIDCDQEFIYSTEESSPGIVHRLFCSLCTEILKVKERSERIQVHDVSSINLVQCLNEQLARQAVSTQ